MIRDIIAEVYPWESRVAIVENGRLAEVFWANKDENVGKIYKGKVKDLIPGLSCAFIDIGLSKNAFLYAGDVKFLEKKNKGNVFDLLKTGQEIMVQVKKEAFCEKGARVTGDLTIPGHFLVLLPFQTEVSISRKITCDDLRHHLRGIIEKNKPENVGIIVRTACLEAEDYEIFSELQEHLKVWNEIKDRYHNSKAPSVIYEDIDVLERTLRDYIDGDISKVIINNSRLRKKIENYISQIRPQHNISIQYEKGDLFEKYGLEKDIRKCLRRKVWLRSGGYLVFDKTEAMTVIDVNSGKYTGKNDFEDTVFRLNMEAAVEIPRQLRLRSVGGIILVDFIDMKYKSNIDKVVTAFKNEIANDKAHTFIAGMTGLGFLEMTRKRSRYGLSDFYSEECTFCNGRGRTINLFALSCQIKRKVVNMDYLENDELVIEVNPMLLDYLTNDKKNLSYIEKCLDKKVIIKDNSKLNLEEYRIFTDQD